MSTPNFHKVHARNYYVIYDETTRYDEETDTDVPCMRDSDDFDMVIDWACEYAKTEKGYTPLNCTYPNSFVRSMDSSAILEKAEWVSFGKKSDYKPFNQFEFKRQIFVHNGHYCGANYDWDIVLTMNCGESYRLSEYDSVDDLIDDITDEWQEEASDTWYEGWNNGLAVMQKKNVKKWLTKMFDKFSDEADDLCRNLCEGVYVCVGIFSNGEAVYEKEYSLKAKVCNVEAA